MAVSDWLTWASKMVNPLHHSSLLYAVYMTVIVETPSGLQYQTVVWALDTGGRVDVDDAARWLCMKQQANNTALQ